MPCTVFNTATLTKAQPILLSIIADSANISVHYWDGPKRAPQKWLSACANCGVRDSNDEVVKSIQQPYILVRGGQFLMLHIADNQYLRVQNFVTCMDTEPFAELARNH